MTIREQPKWHSGLGLLHSKLPGTPAIPLQSCTTCPQTGEPSRGALLPSHKDAQASGRPLHSRNATQAANRREAAGRSEWGQRGIRAQGGCSRDVQDAEPSGTQLGLLKAGRLALLVGKENIPAPGRQPQGVVSRPAHVLYPPRTATNQTRPPQPRHQDSSTGLRSCKVCNYQHVQAVPKVGRADPAHVLGSSEPGHSELPDNGLCCTAGSAQQMTYGRVVCCCCASQSGSPCVIAREPDLLWQGDRSGSSDLSSAKHQAPKPLWPIACDAAATYPSSHMSCQPLSSLPTQVSQNNVSCPAQTSRRLVATTTAQLLRMHAALLIAPPTAPAASVTAGTHSTPCTCVHPYRSPPTATRASKTAGTQKRSPSAPGVQAGASRPPRKLHLGRLWGCQKACPGVQVM